MTGENETSIDHGCNYLFETNLTQLGCISFFCKHHMVFPPRHSVETPCRSKPSSGWIRTPPLHGAGGSGVLAELFFSLSQNINSVCRLQELQEQMVGGEALGNVEIRERRKKKKRHAEEKRRALAGIAYLSYCLWCNQFPVSNQSLMN